MSGAVGTINRHSRLEGPYRSRKRKAEGLLIQMPKVRYGLQNGLAEDIGTDGSAAVPTPKKKPPSWSTKPARSSSGMW